MKSNPAHNVVRLILAPALLLGLILANAGPSASYAGPAAGEATQPQSEPVPAKADPGESAPPTQQGAVIKASDFTVKDLKGKSIHLAELLAKGPVYLNFWTSWCGPCKREMPELDRIHKTYRDRGFAVVAIAQDDSKSVGKVKPYIDSNRFEFIAAADPTKSVGNAYNVRAYPTSFLIKPDGTVAYFAQGYLPGDEKKIESLVRELLELEKGKQVPEAAR